MRLLDRVRAMFTSAPQPGVPSTGTLMDRGGGEEAGWIDETRESAHHHEPGEPNPTLDEHVRPPLEQP